MTKAHGASSTEKAKDAYLGAAEYIDSLGDAHFYSCHAVAMQEGYQYPADFFSHRYPLTTRYAKAFRPDDRGDVWFTSYDDWKDEKSIRVLMLCFMAAMV